MKGRLLFLFLISVGLVFTFAGFPFFKDLPESHYIERVGVIEATEVHLSAKIAERIKALPVNEGDHVAENAVVVRLDDDEMTAELAQAEASVLKSEAGLLNVKAKIAKAKVSLKEAERNLNRISQLRNEELISISDLDRAQTRYDLATAELKAEEAELRSAEAALRERQAHLRLMRVRLKESVIHAPLSGVVTLKAYEVGEMVSPGATILTLIDPKSVWARVDLDEGEVGKIRIGNQAEITVDSLAETTFEGKVTQIGDAGGFATQRDTTRGKQDIKTFRIKIRASSPMGFLKAGMTAKVRIYFNDNSNPAVTSPNPLTLPSPPLGGED
ncbi:MAG: HlyD family secretion protein [Nitrospiria bacterium]